MPAFEESQVQKLHQFWEAGVDKHYADIVTNLVFHGLYQRTVLEPRIRELCALSGLTVANALPQLRDHIKAAFRAGCSEAEVKEAIIQMTTYCGMPYVAQAYRAYEDVLRELKETGGPPFSQR